MRDRQPERGTEVDRQYGDNKIKERERGTLLAMIYEAKLAVCCSRRLSPVHAGWKAE